MLDNVSAVMQRKEDDFRMRHGSTFNGRHMGIFAVP